MGKWIVAALMVSAVVAPSGLAQNEGIAEELRTMRRRLAAVEARQGALLEENAAMRRELDVVATQDVDTAINALSASLDEAYTVVESEANPIHVFGDFRVRYGFSSQRDFGTRVFVGAGPVPQPGAGGGGAGGVVDELSDDTGTFAQARFLVGFDFHFDRNIWTRFSVHAFGLFDNGQTPAPANGLTDIQLYEAFIQMDKILGFDEFYSRSGRQEVVFGNEFQFGNNNYFAGETFDGELLVWEDHDFTVSFFNGTLSITDSFNTRDHPYPTIGSGDGFDADLVTALYGELHAWREFNVDLYWIYVDASLGNAVGTLGNSLGSTSLGDALKQGGLGAEYDYHTLGLRLHGVLDVLDGLDYNFEFAYQTGDTDVAGVDVKGIALEAELGLVVSEADRLRIFTRFLFAEGANGGDTGYIPLFPERHAFADPTDLTAYRARYGLMNIIPLDNVLTAQLGLTFDPFHDITVGATVLWARHDEEVAPGLDENIGWEIDLFAEYRHGESTLIGFSFGVFLPDEGAPLKGGGFAADNDDVSFLFMVDTRVSF